MQASPPARRAGAAVAALALAAVLSGALVPRAPWAAELLLEQDHVRWSSFAFRDRNDFRLRAMTVEPQEGAMVALALDRYPGGCDRLYVSLLITLPAPAGRSLAVMDDVGYARVDLLPIRPLRFDAIVREGGSLIVAQVGRILGEGDFVSDLRRGRAVRFKLGTEHRTYHVHFALEGFTAASERTLALCRSFERQSGGGSGAPAPRGHEDRDYFLE
ncbi:MAG: hypothetical protein M5U08_22135 [Burkholderiales bacterium]|nr:hypothetical protein [Burkholderiales bacterium]